MKFLPLAFEQFSEVDLKSRSFAVYLRLVKICCLLLVPNLCASTKACLAFDLSLLSLLMYRVFRKSKLNFLNLAHHFDNRTNQSENGGHTSSIWLYPNNGSILFIARPWICRSERRAAFVVGFWMILEVATRTMFPLAFCLFQWTAFDSKAECTTG